jgi:hypothetical protein
MLRKRLEIRIRKMRDGLKTSAEETIRVRIADTPESQAVFFQL